MRRKGSTPSRKDRASSISAVDPLAGPAWGEIVDLEGRPVPSIADGEILLNAWAAELREFRLTLLPVAADLFSGLAAMVYNGIAGVVAGSVLVGAHQLIKRLKPSKE